MRAWPCIHIFSISVFHLKLNNLFETNCILHKICSSPNNSLFVEEDSDDDADDEDHGEDGAHHPDEAVSRLDLQELHLQPGRHHGVRVGAGGKRLLRGEPSRQTRIHSVELRAPDRNPRVSLRLTTSEPG